MSDHTQALEIAGRLRDSVQGLEAMADEAGAAAQVKELSSSRRENLLAKHAKQFIGPKVSIALAQILARNEPEYLEEFENLAAQHLAAEQTDRRWKARVCRYEADRSLLSLSKSIKDDLQG